MKQLTRKARNILWPNRRKLEAIVVVISVLVVAIYQFLDKVPYVTFTVEQNILILSIFILLFLEGMATEFTRVTNRINDAMDEVRSDVSILPAHNNSKSKEILRKYIKNNTPNEVKMIEYSSQTIESTIEDAVEVDAQIQLLLKHPDSTTPDNQPERIIQQVKSLHDNLSAYTDMEIRFYEQHAGLRARKFDDDLINCGWYTYQYDDRLGMDLKGHTNPTVLVSKEEGNEYRHLEIMFDRVFDNYWDNGTTLEELYQKEGELDDDIADDLQRWVELRNCEEWVSSVSGNTSDREASV